MAILELPLEMATREGRRQSRVSVHWALVIISTGVGPMVLPSQ